MTTAFLGIDVGWSKKKASCGVAWDAPVEMPGARERFGTIRATACRLDALSNVLRPLLVEFKTAYDQICVVIDGPIGATDPAPVDRAIDSRCAAGGFVKRATSFSLNTPTGQDLSTTTVQILDLLGKYVPITRIIGSAPLQAGAKGALVAETNPTVAMALTLPMARNTQLLPSRSRAILVEGLGYIRAKSDYYWHAGAGAVAASILGQADVGKVSHHELTAGLWCLALARGLANAELGVTALGDDRGVYLVPKRLDETWRQDVERVGVAWGDPAWGRAEQAEDTAIPGTSVPVLAGEASPESDMANAELAVERGEILTLILTDNGGLHLPDNAWLGELELPIQVRTLGESPVRATIFPQQIPTAPYRIEPTTLTLARHQGFEGKHLSRANPHAIDVLPCEDEPCNDASS